MPYELLRRLCAGPLPATIERQVDIDQVAVLQAAGMIDAFLPRVVLGDGRYGYAGPAAVTRVTMLGLAVIERHDRCRVDDGDVHLSIPGSPARHRRLGAARTPGGTDAACERE